MAEMHEISMCKILKRRLNILNQQKSWTPPGAHAATLQMDIEDTANSLREAAVALSRKLQHLKVQQARTGHNTDPAILMGIEDIEAYIAQELNQERS